VTEAHGGVLFIDEIGEMDPILQNKLLKVLEDKRVYFESSYYDPNDPQVPKYIKKLFEEGAPADFVLIGATTRDPSEINPALRSRCAEVFFDPLGREEIEQIVVQAAQRLGATLDPEVPSLISEYTSEGRKATSLLADAYGLALYELDPAVLEQWVKENKARDEEAEEEKRGRFQLRQSASRPYHPGACSRSDPHGPAHALSGRQRLSLPKRWGTSLA